MKMKVLRRIEEEMIVEAENQEEAIEQANFEHANGYQTWKETGYAQYEAKEVKQ